MNREFDLIDKLTQHRSTAGNDPVKGVGDDAAVLPLDDENYLLVSTDSMVEGVHFDLQYFPLRHLGYKAVVSAVSDIYAMNGFPEGLVVSISVPSHVTIPMLEEIYVGIDLASEVCSTRMVGGDTTLSKHDLMICVTVFGKVAKQDVVYRSGAKANDLLCVTGDLGSAYAGFQLLEREKTVYTQNPEMQPAMEEYTYLLERFLKPEPTGGFLEMLKGLSIRPTSMIDISDGLANEVHHLCRQSGTGAVVYAEKLPIDFKTLDFAQTMDVPAETFALYGGEDYQLLFTIALADFEKLKTVEDIAIIGKITEQKGVVQLAAGASELTDLKPLGWDHFGKA
jgi:thiamine-monophosphate kinase